MVVMYDGLEFTGNAVELTTVVLRSESLSIRIALLISGQGGNYQTRRRFLNGAPATRYTQLEQTHSYSKIRGRHPPPTHAYSTHQRASNENQNICGYKSTFLSNGKRGAPWTSRNLCCSKTFICIVRGWELEMIRLGRGFPQWLVQPVADALNEVVIPIGLFSRRS